MNLLIPILTACTSLAGVLIGALLQHRLSKQSEVLKQRQALKTSAYTDYLRSVAETAFLVIQPQATREREILARAADAKTRICIYGSPEVVAALATFERNGSRVRTPEQKECIIRLVSLMRAEVDGADLSFNDLHLILTGSDPSPSD